MHRRRTSSTSILSLPPIDTYLVPTTDLIVQRCPRFRILIVGRSGVGKSSLINAIFKASDVRRDGTRTVDINEGITSEHNNRMIIHDSEGYEPGNTERLGVLEKFIRERSQMEPVGEKLHAIWLCITAPQPGGPMFQPGDEKIFHMNQHKVPIIVVYTKVDLVLPKNRCHRVSAESYFKERCGQSFETLTKGQIPYTAVAASLPETLTRLVDMTLKVVHVEAPSPTSPLPRGRNRLSIKSIKDNEPAGKDEDLADAPEISLAMAQRVDMPAKIAASIKVGKKKYWRAIASGIHFLNVSMEKCLFAIHKDIVTIWNIRDLDKILLSDEFRRRMKVIVEDLSRPDQMNTRALQGRLPIAAAAGLASAWTNGVYKRLPEHIRCLVGYVVDLTLILGAVFRVSTEERLGKEALEERLDEIICEFHLSERKESIHTAIWEFVGPQRPFAKATVDKIESLIRENELTMKDMRFDYKRPALPSLITVIKFERSVKAQTVNKITLGLMRKLLESSDNGTFDSDLGSSSDVEQLLNFILQVLRTGRLLNFGIRDANQKARSLMDDLITKKNVMPGSLFITDVKTSADVSSATIGGFGRIFKGEHKGQPVALKVLSTRKSGSFRKDSGRVALAWGTVTKHRFVLPLMGVFEDKLRLFLVLPFMANGTLSEWRKRKPPLLDINRRMLEVAEGIRHIHSEGIVHGDLRGENIFLDADFHCQIADIGLTQNSDAIITLSASTFLFNYAAPELFITQSENDDDILYEGQDSHKGSKTVETDIYAFGCLYYAIWFDAVPFQGKYEYQIMRLVTSGGRPDRLETPRMNSATWKVIQSCWKDDPLLRPTSEDIKTQLKALGF